MSAQNRLFARVRNYSALPISEAEMQRLTRGCDPNAVDEWGRTALFYAFNEGMSELTLRRLARVTDVSRASTAELTHCAIDTGRLALYLELGGRIVRPAPPSGRFDLGGEPPEHAALYAFSGTGGIGEGGVAALRLLMASDGGDPNARYLGSTVLSRVAGGWMYDESDTLPALRVLLAAGADPLARDDDGRTALEVAEGGVDGAQLLLALHVASRLRARGAPRRFARRGGRPFVRLI